MDVSNASPPPARSPAAQKRDRSPPRGSSETIPGRGPRADATPPARRTTKTRGRLLEAGRTLFAEHGPQAVTSHSIAREAGYAAGTFYLHFKDKLELFRELADDAASDIERRVRSAAADLDDPSEIVQAQAEALVGFAEDQRELLRIAFHPSGEAGDIGARILERLARGVSARRQEAVSEGRALDCFDSDVLAQAIVGMWAHVLAWWAEDPSRADRDDLIRTLTHFQIHGNRAEAGAACCVATAAAGPPASHAPGAEAPSYTPGSSAEESVQNPLEETPEGEPSR